MNYNKAQELYKEYNEKIRDLQMEFAESLRKAGYDANRFAVCLGLDVPIMVYVDTLSPDAELQQEVNGIKYYKVDRGDYTIIEVVQ